MDAVGRGRMFPFGTKCVRHSFFQRLTRLPYEVPPFNEALLATLMPSGTVTKLAFA